MAFLVLNFFLKSMLCTLLFSTECSTFNNTLPSGTHKHPCVNNFGDYIALTHSLLSAAATAEREGNFSKDLQLDGMLAPQKMGTGLKRDQSVAGH